MSFKGKVVLITGASSGIGATTAIKFSKEGAHVSLIARNQKKLNTVANKCKNSLVLNADVTNDEDARRIIDETVRYFGKLDVLVNNAGIANPASIIQDDAMTVYDRVMATNLRAAVLITKLAVPHLVKTKGNVVNISSIASVRLYSKDCFAYSTSKAGLDHFTRAIALELASKGVRVNTVNPGPVSTDIIRNTGATEAEIELFAEKARASSPLNKISDLEEVADIVLFLASEKGKSITGSAYFIDNGLTLKCNVCN